MTPKGPPPTVRALRPGRVCFQQAERTAFFQADLKASMAHQRARKGGRLVSRSATRCDAALTIENCRRPFLCSLWQRRPLRDVAGVDRRPVLRALQAGAMCLGHRRPRQAVRHVHPHRRQRLVGPGRVHHVDATAARQLPAAPKHPPSRPTPTSLRAALPSITKTPADT